MAKRVREVECPLHECITHNTDEDECNHLVRGKYGIHMVYKKDLFLPIPANLAIHPYPYRTPVWPETHQVLPILARQAREARENPPVYLSAYYVGFVIDTNSPLLTKGVAVILGDLTRDDVSCL